MITVVAIVVVLVVAAIVTATASWMRNRPVPLSKPEQLRRITVETERKIESTLRDSFQAMLDAAKLSQR